MDASLILSNLLTPAVLFFGLGVAAKLLRADLDIPAPVTKGLSLYLLFAIGLRGGAELSAAGVSLGTLAPMIVGVAASALLPLASFAILRRRLGPADAAAVAATFGSISAVTFLTTCAFLEDRGAPWSGYMVAVMALMESPAILVGVILARRGSAATGAARTPLRSIVHEAFLNGPVFLLLGSLLIGTLAGEKGWHSLEPFAHAPFKGVLCLFLLDLGLIAATRLDALRGAGTFLVSFATLVPLAHAALGIAAAYAIGLAPGDALLLTVLLASASYIAVPAALRIAIPTANPSIYLPMALGITFPLNIVIGIPLYWLVIERVWGVA
jgi:hypothetical protein